MFIKPGEKFVPMKWHHLCFSRSASSLLIVLDGVLLSQVYEEMPALNIPKDVVPQIIFDLGFVAQNGRIPTRLFFGQLTELFAWSKVLAVKEMKLITGPDCKYAPKVAGMEPDLFDINIIAFDNKSKNYIVQKIERTNPIFCGNNDINGQKKPYMLRGFKRNFKGSVELCKSYGGNIAVPKNKMDFDEMRDAVKNNALYMLQHDCNNQYWIGIEKKNGTWVGTNGEENPYTVWADNQPNGMDIQKCVIIMGKGKK